MKNKKFLSLVLALSMLMPTAFVANAEGYTQVSDDYFSYAWNGGGKSSTASSNGVSSGGNGTSIFTSDDSKSGDVSVYFDLTTATTNTNKATKQWKNRIYAPTMKAGHTYVMGAWMKQFGTKTSGEFYIALGYDSKHKGIDLTNPDQAKAMETVDGWTRYEGTYTPTEDVTAMACFGAYKLYGEDLAFLVDDIYIYDQADLDKGNLVDDASFEMFQKQPPKQEYWNEAITGASDWVAYTEMATDASVSYRQLVTGAGQVYEGNQAIYIKRKGTSLDGLAYSNYKTKETMEPGTYTITFYTKGGAFKNYFDSGKAAYYQATMDKIKNTSENDVSKTLFSLMAHQTLIGIQQEGVDIYSQNDPAVCSRLSYYDSFEYVGDGWVKWTKEVETTVASNMVQYIMYSTAADESYYFDGLSVKDANGKEYCPDGGFEFEPAEKKTWEIVGYNYAYTDEGEIVEYITDLEAGEIYGGVEIINYEEEDLSVAVAVAVYENGMLKDVTLVEDDIPIAADSETAKVGGSVTVPEMDPEKEYLMKVMVWDSIKGMMPFEEADILE